MLGWGCRRWWVCNPTLWEVWDAGRSWNLSKDAGFCHSMPAPHWKSARRPKMGLLCLLLPICWLILRFVGRGLCVRWANWCFWAWFNHWEKWRNWRGRHTSRTCLWVPVRALSPRWSREVLPLKSIPFLSKNVRSLLGAWCSAVSDWLWTLALFFRTFFTVAVVCWWSRSALKASLRKIGWGLFRRDTLWLGKCFLGWAMVPETYCSSVPFIVIFKCYIQMHFIRHTPSYKHSKKSISHLKWSFGYYF